MAVNKVLSALASAGLIVRRRRSGSFVANPKSQETVLEIHDIQAEIKATGKPYRHDVLWRTIRRATRKDAGRLGVRTGAKVLAIGVLHFAAAVPFALEDRLISLAAVPGAARQDFSSFPPGTWLLEHIPWTQAEHTIKAEIAKATLLRVSRSRRVTPVWWLSARHGRQGRGSLTFGCVTRAVGTNCWRASRLAVWYGPRHRRGRRYRGSERP